LSEDVITLPPDSLQIEVDDYLVLSCLLFVFLQHDDNA